MTQYETVILRTISYQFALLDPGQPIISSIETMGSFPLLIDIELMPFHYTTLHHKPIHIDSSDVLHTVRPCVMLVISPKCDCGGLAILSHTETDAALRHGVADLRGPGRPGLAFCVNSNQ